MDKKSRQDGKKYAIIRMDKQKGQEVIRNTGCNFGNKFIIPDSRVNEKNSE